MLSPIPPLLPARALVEMLAGDPDTELMHDPSRLRPVGCPLLLQYGAEDTCVPVDGQSKESPGHWAGPVPPPRFGSTPASNTCSTSCPPSSGPTGRR